MAEQTIHYSDRIIRICVDKAEQRQISGRIYHCLLEGPYFFADLSDLILQVEKILDLQGYPQAFQKKRTFSKANYEPLDWEPQILTPLSEIEKEKGELSTFHLLIFSRQNTTWQGKIDWLSEGKEKTNFHSALEFIFLVDQYLSK